MNINANPVVHSLRQLDGRLETTSEKMTDFIRRQTNGENPDPGEFMRLLQKTEVTKSAMEAQYQLLEKPLKTVLSETR